MAPNNSEVFNPLDLYKNGAAFIDFKGQLLSIKSGASFGSLIPPFHSEFNDLKIVRIP